MAIISLRTIENGDLAGPDTVDYGTDRRNASHSLPEGSDIRYQFFALTLIGAVETGESETTREMLKGSSNLHRPLGRTD